MNNINPDGRCDSEDGEIDTRDSDPSVGLWRCDWCGDWVDALMCNAPDLKLCANCDVEEGVS